MFSPRATNPVELSCDHTAGISGKAFRIWIEKFARVFPGPLETIAAAGGGKMWLRLSTHPEVRLAGPGLDGVIAQEDFGFVAEGSSGQ